MAYGDAGRSDEDKEFRFLLCESMALLLGYVAAEIRSKPEEQFEVDRHDLCTEVAGSFVKYAEKYLS